MITLSGNNRLQMPEVNQFSFTFDPLFVQTTGASNIIFSNSSGVTGFSFLLSGQNIYLKSSGINKKVCSYNLNEAITLSGAAINGPSGYNYLDFYVNGIHINAWQELVPTNVSLINVNVATGDSLSLNLKLNSNNINYSFNLPNQYTAFGSTSGTISSDTNFWILNSSTIFSQSYQSLLSADTIIAPVKTNQPLVLTLNDLDDSSQDYNVEMTSYITSNIGEFVLDDTIARTGNNASSMTNFRLLSNSNNISGLFDGNWSGNNFVFNDTPEQTLFNYEYSKMDVNGNYDTNQKILIKYEAVNPLSGQSYPSEYITGFKLNGSGQYSYPPDVVFNNYYYITGISQAYNSLLFSSGCTGNLPVIFTGGGGNGASGYLQIAQVTLANLYQAGNAVYSVVTGGVFNYLGSNYTGIASGVVLTGIFGNTCYDVPRFYNSGAYSFIKFNNTGVLSPQASFLTGFVLGMTGLIGTGTGFFVTGLDISNIGYGYNASRTPSVTFIRQSGDLYSSNASGTLLLKATGNYNMGSVWTIYTGWTNNNLYPLESGLSGVFSTQNRYFTISLNCSGLDNTSGVINKLSVLPSFGSGNVQLVTGTKYFSTDPYFLKKKLNTKSNIVISGDLSFLMTQTELDTIYSSYTSNLSLDLGDLDF